MQQVHNADIAKVFSEIADLLELEDGNPFRVRAYRTAARTVETLGPDVGDLLKEGRDLCELPGIGSDLAGRIAEIVQDGTCALREQLRTELPEGIDKLLRVPGLGPKRVKLLYQERGIHTPEQLLRAAQEGQLRTIKGLGEKAEQRILEAVQAQPDGLDVGGWVDRGHAAIGVAISSTVGPTSSASGCSLPRSKPYTPAMFSAKIIRSLSSGQSWNASRSDSRVDGNVPSSCG